MRRRIQRPEGTRCARECQDPKVRDVPLRTVLTRGSQVPISTSHLEISELMGRVSRAELKLPEIQRGYIWKPPQVAGLLDSLYREYPSGSLLLWQADEDPATREMRISAGSTGPTTPALYLLDGQQRLTSLHRVFTNHEGAQIVFNVETEKFQNQSAATKKDKRWIKVHDVLAGKSRLAMVNELVAALPQMDAETVDQRLAKLQAVTKYRYYLEII